MSREFGEKPVDKAGPWMANVKAGPSIGFNGLPVTAAVQAELGFAFLKGTGRGLGGGDLYGVVSPEFQIGSSVVAPEVWLLG